MKKKIIYVVKDRLHDYPPCISQIVMLRNIGIDVVFITEICDEKTMHILKKNGAEVKILGGLRKYGGAAGRIEHWLKFKHKASNAIEHIYNAGDVVWYGTERTGMVLAKKNQSRKTILNVFELYSRESLFGFCVGKIVHKCDLIIACEINRSRIMKLWYKLNKMPIVMPNKPSYDVTGETSAEVSEIQNKLKDSDYILYQGILNPERPLDILAEALNHTKKQYVFAILGKAGSEKQTNEMISRLSKIYPKTVYCGFLPPPQHLHITQGAHIGVAIYDDVSLNTMFCAPNKTFEYAKYGIPILGSDVPGLQLSIENGGAGICVDIKDATKISDAIDKIEQNYECFSNGARDFYNSVDNSEKIRKIVEEFGLI